MNRSELWKRMAGALFLSAMLDLTDAEYCVERGEAAGMVQLGTMIVAPETDEYAPYRQRWSRTFLPTDRGAMCAQLQAEVGAVRVALGDTLCCLSLAGFAMDDVVAAAESFWRAGGDFVELNVHGSLQPWASQGYLIGMAQPQYRQRLVAWAQALAALEIPLVIKFNTRLDVDFAQVLHDLRHVPVWGYHFNVRDPQSRVPKYEFVERIRPLVQGPLLCSGYAWTAEAVRRLVAAGADSVGVAEPVMNDRHFILKLRQELGS